jgi:hypothetical protein
MDPRIQSLIASCGGYAYEIAGQVAVFFSDLEQTREFGKLLGQLAGIEVNQCGSQLTFPASARVGAENIARLACAAPSEQRAPERFAAGPSRTTRRRIWPHPGLRRPEPETITGPPGQLPWKQLLSGRLGNLRHFRFPKRP